MGIEFSICVYSQSRNAYVCKTIDILREPASMYFPRLEDLFITGVREQIGRKAIMGGKEGRVPSEERQQYCHILRYLQC